MVTGLSFFDTHHQRFGIPYLWRSAQNAECSRCVNYFTGFDDLCAISKVCSPPIANVNSWPSGCKCKGRLKPGCHVNAIGSNWPDRREIDQLTVQRSNLIVTDSKEQALAEAGDLIIPANKGSLNWNSVHELADVVAVHGPQRETPDDITLYKGLGIALEDIATAYHVYALAKQQGMGEELDLLT